MINNNMLKMLMSSSNPQQMAMNMLSQYANGNPIAENIVGMMNNGNYSGIEQVARNLCSEKGIDADAMLNNIKHSR